MSVVDRARAELARGRPWKARQRLEGPSQTRRQTSAFSSCSANAATAALRERFPTPAALFTALPVKAPPAAYPPPARQRLERLLDEAEPKWLWTKKLDSVGRRRHGWSAEESSRVDEFVSGAIITAIVGTWIVGAVTIVYLAFRLVRALV